MEKKIVIILIALLAALGLYSYLETMKVQKLRIEKDRLCAEYEMKIKALERPAVINKPKAKIVKTIEREVKDNVEKYKEVYDIDMDFGNMTMPMLPLEYPAGKEKKYNHIFSLCYMLGDNDNYINASYNRRLYKNLFGMLEINSNKRIGLGVSIGLF